MAGPHMPVNAGEFAEWFDSDGRLVKEVTMRQIVFEGLLHTCQYCIHDIVQLRC